jgi:hypothetical protein
MRARQLVKYVAFLLALVPAAAAAQPCAREGTRGPRLPLGVTVDAADLSTMPSPCGGATVSMEARGTALLAVDDFYGTLHAGLVLGATLPIARGLWLSAAVTPVQYRFVQNVSVVGDRLGLGASTVGLHGAVLDTSRWRVSLYGRLRAPTETGQGYGFTTGGEVGVAALWAPAPRVTVAMGAGVPLEVSVIGGWARGAVTAHAGADVAVRLGRVEPALGLALRVGGDPAGALEFVAPRMGLRVHPGRRWVMGLDAVFPLGGVDATDARFALTATHAL